jgi:hypothetical protein
MSVYFCHPHSPWENGTCENTNDLIRDMLYPVEDFRELVQRDVIRIARLLNERSEKHLTLGRLMGYSRNCARNYRGLICPFSNHKKFTTRNLTQQIINIPSVLFDKNRRGPDNH